ncbi:MULTISPECIES: hypothetical protein [Halobacteriovorax]|uniref:Outer membrane protein beta-barrel domain-containing protein n=1 Tax=Halobacteriovorax vibrionivorans TaxID=2152716 RepID=A0ABY0IHN0_9BACT|nr:MULTISPECIES: hypothetical protein [Halobacteriovorax]AYF45366.1 hypothetical protein BALOs_2369 [Halobacteriovorax sp. BALOs_7]RZF22450.1 hypothetical protein DAY19_01375 [Halobacteriovorax vibrionivorans]TGD47641.1 hypothetical protein EP118_06735 [Halobacteriovorax sp. Y22]
MIKKTLIKYFILSFITSLSFGMTELDLDFNYNKNILGSNRESFDRTRTYAGSLTFYFLTYTGIEFNIAHSENEIYGKYDNSGVSSGLVIQNETTNIETRSYGIGIRQAFSSRKSFIQPLLSLGWSHQEYTLKSRTLVTDLDTSTDYLIESQEDKTKYSAMFAAFALKFRLTRFISLKGSVKTVFRAFEFEEARDQLSYNAGISWIF